MSSQWIVWNLNCHCLILPDVLLVSQLLFISTVFILFILIFFFKKSCFWFLISFSIPSLLFTFLLLSPLFSSFFRNETEKLRNVLSHIFFSLKKEKIFSLCFKETLQLLQRHCKNKKNYTLSALCFNIFLSPLCIFFLHNSNHPFLQLFLCHYS